MRIRRKFVSFAFGSVVMLGMVGAASAAQAVATGSVNVRSGPSAQYERVGSLQRNQLVEVTGCQSGWCFVEKPGADGWVSANYLQQVRSQRSASKPSINFSFSFGSPPVVRPPRHNGGWNGDAGWNGDGGWNGGHHNDGNWNGNDGPDWDGPRPNRRH